MKIFSVEKGQVKVVSTNYSYFFDINEAFVNG